MIFLELVLQNFGPYFGKQTINLRPTLSDRPCPIILFGGMNGGGKTTLLDAIRLALYGHRAQCSTRGNLTYGDFLSQCVNRNTPPTEKTRIELAFEHIQDDQIVEYRIVRTWEKNPKDGKDTLGILDGEWPDYYLANTWDEYIENLLPLGISNLFLFDGEQVKELAELETPPPLVVDAIQSLLGLELAERLAADLDILVTRKKKQLAKTKEIANLEEIEQKINQQKTDLEVIKNKKSDLEKKLKKSQEKQKKAMRKFVSEGGKIAAERSQLEQELKDTELDVDNARQEMVELAGGALPLALISPLLEQASSQGDLEILRHEAEIALDAFQERDKRLLNYLDNLSISTDKISKIEEFLNQENLTLKDDINQVNEPWLSADEETLILLENLLRYEIEDSLKSARESLTRLKDFEVEIDILEKQLAAAAPPEAYEILATTLQESQTELARAEVAYENSKRDSKKLEDAITQTKKELLSYTDETIERHNIQHIINSSAKVKQTLQLFKHKLTLKKLNKLEIEVTECFRYLLHKSDLVHRVAIDTDNFTLFLYNNQGQLVPKNRISAGEKQLLAISFLWGLARVSGRRLPVAIDTPLGRLDSSHRQNLVERYFPAASHQVILFSTDTEISKSEVENLRNLEAIANEYLLKYDAKKNQTNLKKGYFW
ncbi:MAG: DNA sulfur modification protein DndD [Trichodesmium sp. St16_bin4-tuft]|nr:DNA sulfur modification protein DndD [Trichodesmium sp. MAG_R01]MDE5092601.1 DNA sulfur modification protein DndD [Trichodesmium sp. St18_bin3_1_1]MDE5098737.1 DNA sulfur modification protein DndD [Trichodesmium sp. St16_bin4-tuft]